MSEKLGSFVMTGYFLSLRTTPDGGLMRWISFMAAAGARGSCYCCWRTAAATTAAASPLLGP